MARTGCGEDEFCAGALVIRDLRLLLFSRPGARETPKPYPHEREPRHARNSEQVRLRRLDGKDARSGTDPADDRAHSGYLPNCMDERTSFLDLMGVGINMPGPPYSHDAPGWSSNRGKCAAPAPSLDARKHRPTSNELLKIRHIACKPISGSSSQRKPAALPARRRAGPGAPQAGRRIFSGRRAASRPRPHFFALAPTCGVREACHEGLLVKSDMLQI
jgi:hypothetical protein